MRLAVDDAVSTLDVVFPLLVAEDVIDGYDHLFVHVAFSANEHGFMAVVELVDLMHHAINDESELAHCAWIDYRDYFTRKNLAVVVSKYGTATELAGLRYMFAQFFRQFLEVNDARVDALEVAVAGSLCKDKTVSIVPCDNEVVAFVGLAVVAACGNGEAFVMLVVVNDFAFDGRGEDADVGEGEKSAEGGGGIGHGELLVRLLERCEGQGH